jgi:hypothetical protein
MSEMVIFILHKDESEISPWLMPVILVAQEAEIKRVMV